MNSEQDDQDTGENSERTRKHYLNDDQLAEVTEYRRMKKRQRRHAESESSALVQPVDDGCEEKLAEQSNADNGGNSSRKRKSHMTEEELAARKERKRHETVGERFIRKLEEREARMRSRDEPEPSDLMLFADDEEENRNSGRERFNNCSSSSSSSSATSSSSSSSAMTSDQARARDYLTRPAALSRERPNVSDRVQDTQDELAAEKKRERTKHKRRQLEDERRFYPGAGLVGLNARVYGTRKSDRTLTRRVMDYSNGQHASLPQIQNARNPAGRKRICLGDSRLPGGGTGLFALESFKAGDKVCPYGPAGSTPGCNNSDLMGVYSTDLKQTFSGDESGERYYGGFINDNPELGYNCMFMFQDVKTRGGIRQRLIIETTTDVDPGVEFSLYYGDEYWNRERTQRTSEIGEPLPLGNNGDVAWEIDDDTDSDA